MRKIAVYLWWRQQDSKSLTPATVELFELLGYDLKVVPVKRKQHQKK
jgi:hypothetical protein